MTYRKGEGNAKAEACLDRAGYKRGGAVSDEKQDKKMIAAAVHKHEKHDHKGEKLTKLKAGGKVDGGKSAPRADRYARGGRTKEKGSKVNIAIVVPHGQGAGASPMGAAPPGPSVPAPMPARPPMAPAAGPGMPPGAMPPHPPMKRGGRVKGAIHLTAGAGGGEGRLEKRRQAKVETR